MPVSIGPRIQVDGEAEYRQQISNIIEQGKTLDAEMRALTATFSDNATAEEKAAATTDLLNLQLDNARERTRLVREMTQKSAETTEENSRETLKWRQALANAKEQQAKLERAVEDNTKALDKQGEAAQENQKQMTGLGDVLEKLAPSTGKLGDQVNFLSDKLGINIPKDATKALNGIEGFSVGTVAKMGAVAAAVAAAVEAVKALYNITIEAAARADDLLTQSVITGVSTETLQQWQYAADFIDVSVDTMTGSMTKLTNSAYDAANGNDKLAATFASLGVSVTDSSGQLRPAEEIFYDVVDALGKVQNQTERDAIAMDIMGRSAQELNPLIDQGSEALRGYSEEAEAAGYVLDEYQLAKLGDVDDAYHKWQLQLEATKNQLAVAFAPVAEAALKGVTAVVNVLTNALAEMNEMAEKAARAFKSLLGQKSEMQSYGLGSDVFGATWKDDVQAYVTAGGTVITPDIIDQIDKTTGKPKNNFYLGEILPGESAYSYGHMDEAEIEKLLKKAGYNAAGDENWRGGWTWVGEGGPERVWLPQGSKIYSNEESREMAGGVTIGTVVIEARTIRELNDLVRIFQGAQIEGRMS